MKFQHVRWPLVALVCGLLAAGCNELVAPGEVEQVPDGQLTIVQVSADAPPLTHTDVSVWAVRGKARMVEMRYEAYGNANGKCLRFIIPEGALLKHPDGSNVAMGDSVRINIRVLNASHFVFEFDPAGVRFDPQSPARLEIRYRWADVNGDGLATEADAADFALYRQELPGMVWEKVPSTQYADSQELHASITGFSRYALATD